MKMTSPYALSAVGLAVFSALSFSASANTNDDQVIVSANRFQQPVSSVLAPVTVVTREEIDKWQSNSVVDILRRLPGVDVTQSGGLGQNSTVSVRGTDAKHLLVLIDGVRLNNAGISGQPDLNQFPVALVQRVEYIRGARSAVYGSDAIGGVLNIITIRDDIGSNITAGIGSHGYQNYTGTTQQQIGENTRVTAAAAYTYSKGYKVRENLPYSSGDFGFMNKTYWLDVHHKLDDRFAVYGRAYGFDNRSKYLTPNQSSRELENRTYDAGVTFNQDDYSSQLIMSFSHVKDYNFENRYGRYGQGATLDNSKQYSVQWGNNYRIGYGSINAGVDYQKQEVEPGTAFTAESKSVSDTGLYLTGQQEIGSVILEAAVRSDHHSELGWHTTWQTSAGWEFIDGYRMIGSYATGYKAPTMGQLYAYNPVWNLKGNPNLKPEESKQWELGLEGLTGPLSWKLNAYHNDIDNMIDFYSDPITYAGTYYNINNAKIKGVEWTGEFDTWIFHHQMTYQYLDARDKDTDKRLARRAQQQVKYQLDWNVADIDMGLTYQYIGKRYDDRYNTRKLGGVSVFDITAAYPITDHLTIRGKVANLFDKDYETAYGYRTAGREYFLTGSYNF
ncbi:TonB-dependent vitamin B12 receptor BtuB [Morganella morganii]|uniref:TonB-dependent vitamin B12 receptor BtuB n=1 Tax=Morganella morganii TaxID=582 RepID=UPI001BD9794C|nr:TonB-dependent vitamin B12 receptor BtuB [Morganella morganii]MBT0386268.1 TonB-dependent vitamin B12 receptor BtuB [Morganella morganii subsp. morganii]